MTTVKLKGQLRQVEMALALARVLMGESSAGYSQVSKPQMNPSDSGVGGIQTSLLYLDHGSSIMSRYMGARCSAPTNPFTRM